MQLKGIQHHCQNSESTCCCCCGDECNCHSSFLFLLRLPRTRSTFSSSRGRLNSDQLRLKKKKKTTQKHADLVYALRTQRQHWYGNCSVAGSRSQDWSQIIRSDKCVDDVSAGGGDAILPSSLHRNNPADSGGRSRQLYWMATEARFHLITLGSELVKSSFWSSVQWTSRSKRFDADVNVFGLF